MPCCDLSCTSERAEAVDNTAQHVNMMERLQRHVMVSSDGMQSLSKRTLPLLSGCSGGGGGRNSAREQEGGREREREREREMTCPEEALLDAGSRWSAGCSKCTSGQGQIRRGTGELREPQPERRECRGRQVLEPPRSSRGPPYILNPPAPYLSAW